MNEFLNSWRFAACIGALVAILAVVGGPKEEKRPAVEETAIQKNVN